ncbi:hypothetical protein L1987_33233 [Smallanthus sonchifolius]|uniref:Uncharacterized protein n=1 Tax=Smallanthus sonchifolius TaxID=185202 RepID=A0ACB9HRB2_9ASTR|nr:hypothetical protein L1987_33233 [Smallanthus sonchifolius]
MVEYFKDGDKGTQNLPLHISIPHSIEIAARVHFLAEQVKNKTPACRPAEKECADLWTRIASVAYAIG